MGSKRGFTLVEMALVVGLLGIISTITIIAISRAMSGIQLGGAVEKLVSDLRYAQNMAGGTGQWYGVSFEVNSYSVYTTTGTLDTIVANPASLGKNFVINLATDFNASISSVSFDGGSKVEFSPLGTPYTDKSPLTLLVAEGVIILAKGSSTREVRVSPNTGRIYAQ